jgi:hypothetical protein
VFGIFTSRAMRERGRYQLQLMKTRNSSGVGQKIDLGFDVDTLRIIDCDEDDEDNGSNHSGGQTSSSIVSSLKRNNTASVPDDPQGGAAAPKIRAETDSTKLRSFLNNLGDE